MNNSDTFFTKYHYIHKVDDDHYYLLHTLLGGLELISPDEKKLIDKWISDTSINPQNDFEDKLFTDLLSRKYILSSEDEKNLFQNAVKLAQKSSENSKQVITFVLSYNCNFCCPYCFEKDKDNESRVLSKELIDKVFDLHNNNIPFICFYGGEPFLTEHREAIEYIVSKAPNACYSAITNGYNLDLFLDILKKVKTDFFQITLDGVQEIHDKFRKLKDGGETYEKILNNIDLLLQNNIAVKIRMNITEQNISSCISLREQLSNKYKNKPLYFELQPVFQLSDNINKKLKIMIHESDVSKENKLLPSGFVGKNTIVNTYKPLQKFASSTDSFCTPIINNCDAETKRLIYDPYGLFYSCLVSVGTPAAACGTYYPTYALKAKGLLKRSVLSIKECQKCPLALICGGGCGYHVIDEDEDSLKPNCKGTKDFLDNDLPVYLQRKYKSLF